MATGRRRPQPLAGSICGAAAIAWAGAAADEAARPGGASAGAAALEAALRGRDLLKLRETFKDHATRWPACVGAPRLDAPTPRHCRPFAALSQWAQRTLGLDPQVARLLDYCSLPGELHLTTALRLFHALMLAGHHGHAGHAGNDHWLVMEGHGVVEAMQDEADRAARRLIIALCAALVVKTCYARQEFCTNLLPSPRTYGEAVELVAARAALGDEYRAKSNGVAVGALGGRALMFDLIGLGPAFWRGAARAAGDAPAPVQAVPLRALPAAAWGSAAARFPRMLQWGQRPGRQSALRPIALRGMRSVSGFRAHAAEAGSDGEEAFGSDYEMLLREGVVVGASLRSDALGERFAVEVAIYVASWNTHHSACESWPGADDLRFRCLWPGAGGLGAADEAADAEVLSTAAWIASVLKRSTPPFVPRTPMLLTCEVPDHLARRLREDVARDVEWSDAEGAEGGAAPAAAPPAPLALAVDAPGSADAWAAGVPVRLYPRPGRRPAPRLAVCSKPLYSMDRQAAALAQWILYHAALGAEAVDIYDIDGSAEPAVGAVRDAVGAAGAALTYFPRFPQGFAALRNLSFGAQVGGLHWCGADCLFPLQQVHCVMRHRGLASEWVLTGLSADEYLGVGAALVRPAGSGGVPGPASRGAAAGGAAESPREAVYAFLGGLPANVSTLHLLNAAFGSTQEEADAPRQDSHLPVVERFQKRLAVPESQRRLSPYKRSREFTYFSSLVRPAATLSVVWEASRSYVEFQTRPADLDELRINHYVNLYKPRVVAPAAEFAADGGTAWSWPALRPLAARRWPARAGSGVAATSGRVFATLAAHAIEVLDSDGSGGLSPAEFAVLLDSRLYAEDAEQRGIFTRVKALDIQLHTVGVWWGPGDDSDALFSGMDADRSGELTANEFGGGMAAAVAAP